MFTSHLFTAFKALSRRLIRRYLRLILIAVLVSLIALIYFLNKNFGMQMTTQPKLSKDLLDLINHEVSRCLELRERKDQNKRFSAIRNDVLKPIKMTLTTAVFKYDDKGKGFVVKRVISKEDSPTQEASISTMLRHPNIIRTLGTDHSHFFDRITNRQHIVWVFTEFLQERVSQRNVVGDEELIRRILMHSLNGLVYMHDKKNIIHLDIKIANIMGEVTRKGVIFKLIDFGYSRDLNKERHPIRDGCVYIKGKSYGTYPYKPPEVVYSNLHGKKSDIWCVGAVAWFLSLMETPFYKEKGDKNVSAYKAFLLGEKKHWFAEETSKELKDFILCCMRRSYAKRPNANQLLNHPFIKGKTLREPWYKADESDSYDYLSSESDSSDWTGAGAN